MFKVFIQKLSIDIIFKSLLFIIAIFIGGYSIKVLGLQQLGIIQAIQAAFVFFQCMIGINIFNNAIINFTAEKQQRGPSTDISSIINTCNAIIICYTSLFCLIAGALSCFGWLKEYFAESIFFILLVGLIQMLNGLAMIYQSFATGLGKLVTVGVLDGIFSMANSLMVFVALVFWGNIWVYLCSQGVISLLRVIFYSGFCSKKYHYHMNASLSWKLLKTMPLFCRSAYIGSLTQLFNCCADTIFVGITGGFSAVPIYTMSQNILFGIHSLVCNTAGNVFPLLSGRGELAIVTLRNIRYKLFWGISRMSLLLYSFAAIFVPVAMSKLVNHDFGRDLRFFMFFAGLMGLGMMFAAYASTPLLVLKKVRTVAIGDWITTIGVFLLTLLLGYFFAAAGVVIARTFFVISGIYYLYRLNLFLGVSQRKLFEIVPVLVEYALFGALSIFVLNINSEIIIQSAIGLTIFAVMHLGLLIIQLYSKDGTEIRSLFSLFYNTIKNK